MKKLDSVQEIEAFLPFDQIITEEEERFSCKTRIRPYMGIEFLKTLKKDYAWC